MYIKYLHNFVVCETMLLFVENALECFDLIIIMTRGADNNLIISPTLLLIYIPYYTSCGVLEGSAYVAYI